MSSFDSRGHEHWLRGVQHRVKDGSLLRRLQAWLRAPGVVERAEGRSEIHGSRKTRRGTPPGGVSSPRLANVYRHVMDRAGKDRGLAEQLQARLIRYAEDFVGACRGTAAAVHDSLAGLALTLNQAKTRLVDLRRDAIRCLGFDIRGAQSPRTGGTFPLVCPSPKALQQIRTILKRLTGRERAPRPDALVSAEVNQAVVLTPTEIRSMMDPAAESPPGAARRPSRPRKPPRGPREALMGVARPLL